MALSVGDKLGPYQIVAPIGKGGMGEGCKTLDTKLDREVALKILPSALAQDRERLARLEREAKVLASLNHPNIAQIYGIEESSTGRALVMELVPGETLKGPFPLETALKYAKQITEPLETACDKGITHRDLKPANIMVTPACEVLDFGLAAVTQPSASSKGDPGNSPTLTMRATQAGMILGTAVYMAKLVPLVFSELHRLARRYMALEQPGQTLQVTALVKEAYIRLVDSWQVSWKSRAHLFAVCAQMMGRILVDHARARNAWTRGIGVPALELEEALVVSQERSPDLVALDDAPKALSAFDPRKGQVVELRLFGGLNVEETAEVLKVSKETVNRDWQLAKSWIRRELSGETTSGT